VGGKWKKKVEIFEMVVTDNFSKLMKTSNDRFRKLREH
jgi:hypothetical protein